MSVFANSKSELTADRNPEKNCYVLLGVFLNINFNIIYDILNIVKLKTKGELK